MVPTSAAHGEHARAFIGAYAPRFLDTDTRGRLTVNMAELDAIVTELIAAAVANELRAEATTLHREATECTRVADYLTGGEQA